MTPIDDYYISYTQTFPQKKFLSQKMSSSSWFVYTFNRSHQEADICGEKNSSKFHSLNFERVFNF